MPGCSLAKLSSLKAAELLLRETGLGPLETELFIGFTSIRASIRKEADGCEPADFGLCCNDLHSSQCYGLIFLKEIENHMPQTYLT